ncbi:MAG: DUF2232 domain-containing protein [Alsobacter sp.]
MQALIGIGFGAGLVSALLFAVVVTRSLLALAVFMAAPMPVLLASLGWNHRAGLIAAGVGSLLLLLLFGWPAAAMFAVSIALPAWWAAYLLLLARRDEAGVEWYPLGRLLVWTACIASALTLVGAVLLGDGSYGDFIREFERAAQKMAEAQPGLFAELAPGERNADMADIGRLIANIAPPASAAVSVLVSVALLWAAARIVLASGRLPRPWGGIQQVRIPGMWLAILPAVAVLGLLVGGFAGLGLRSLTASLLMAYCLQGLAVIHVLTQGVAGRGGILTGVWLTFVMMPGWPVLLYALVGVVDSVLDLRSRKAASRPPPPSGG